MDIEQTKLKQVRSLTPKQQQFVLDESSLPTALCFHDLKNKRVPGLHQADGYWMADDFDASLPDEFWL